MASENENEKRETVADVVAIVRRAAQYYEGEAEKSEGLLRESFKLSAANYREIANLVEAAWKRESRAIATEHAVLPAVCITRPSGNAAAMREALIEMRDHADKKIGVTCNVSLLAEYGWFVQKINAALSAPARNCDIYTTSGEADQAMTEYCSKMAETGECVKSCPYREAEGGCAFGWLLAATETKGEADGSK